MRSLDDGPDGLNDAAWERALSGKRKRRAKRPVTATKGKNPGGIEARESCRSHPQFGDLDAVDDHEPMATEMRCAYCGERLRPVTCSGCGKFMTAAEMHAAYYEGIWRCEECA